MYDYGPMMYGNDWVWGIFMMFFWLIVLLIVVAVFMRIFKEHDHHRGDIQKSEPLNIVKERYAKGEINKEQFEQLKKDLVK